jgi:hypothetical protein
MDREFAKFRIELYHHVNEKICKPQYEKEVCQHNHLPLPYIVESCDYCKKYGNFFASNYKSCQNKQT